MAKTFSAYMNKNNVNLIENGSDEKLKDKKTIEISATEENKSDNDSDIVYRDSNKNITIEISLKTILLILAIVGVFFVFPKILEVLILLFFAFLIASGVMPGVRWLEKKGLSKSLSILVVYLTSLIVIFGVIVLVVTPFVNQFTKLSSDLPNYATEIAKKIESFNIPYVNVNQDSVRTSVDNYVKNITKNLNSITSGLKETVNALKSVAGGILTFLSVLVLSVYMVSDHDNFLDILASRIINLRQRDRVKKLVQDVENKLGNWLVGQGLLCLIIGFMVWVLLMILKVPFALPLAVLAGLFEALPTFGPIISAVPPALIALVVHNPLSALIVLLGFTLIQQLENHLIVPKVMGNVVGLNPLVVIIGILIGFNVGSILGAMLAIPVMVIAKILYEFYVDLQKIRAQE